MSTSRKVARGQLVTLLDAALVSGAPKLAKAVVGYKVTDLAGQTPLVSVLSASSSRPTLTFRGLGFEPEFELQVWVSQATDGWTNEQAEDALDDIEAKIAETVESNVAGDHWSDLSYGGPSIILEVAVGGRPYYLERIPLSCRVPRS